MSKKTVEIDARLHERAQSKAAREGKTLVQVVQEYLARDRRPGPKVKKPRD